VKENSFINAIALKASSLTFSVALVATFTAGAEEFIESPEQLNSIYEKHYAQPIPANEWSEIVGAQLNETYTVQRGDTLWSISQILFGNPFFWPKIWQLNETITNPHLISVGKVLQFRSNGLEPLSWVIGSGDSQGEEYTEENLSGDDSEQVDLTADLYEMPLIPPQEKKSVPVLKELPSSLSPLFNVEEGGTDRLGFYPFKHHFKRKYTPSITLPGYFSEKIPDVIGRITLLEETGQAKAMAPDFAYIKFKEGKDYSGQRVRTFRVLRSIEGTEDVHLFGVGVELHGEVQVLHKVNPDDNIYRAQVLSIIYPVLVGDLIMPGDLERIDTENFQNGGNVSGRILGGIENSDQKIMFKGHIVFLSLGRKDGVKLGDRYPIFKNPAVRSSAGTITRNLIQIGILQVVNTSEKVATGWIVESEDRIIPGDIFGNPKFGGQEIQKSLRTHLGGSASEASDGSKGNSNLNFTEEDSTILE